MEIIILPAEGCRRSLRVLDYLDENEVTYKRIDLETEEGQALMERHQLRSSPGILVDGVLVNPFDILEAPACRMREPEASRTFGIVRAGTEDNLSPSQEIDHGYQSVD